MVSYINSMDSMNNNGNGPSKFNSSLFDGTGPDFNPGRGRKGNDDTDTTTAPILLGVGGGLMVLSLLLLAVRLWSRLKPNLRLQRDDWSALVATILALINYSLLSSAVVHGFGRHQRFVTFNRRRTALELMFISQVFWFWAITFVKLSVAFLMLRIKAQDRRWRIFLHTIMIILFLAAIVQTCFQFLQCRPFSVFWDPTVFVTTKGGVKCFSRSVINANIVAFSGLQVAMDLLFSFIPILFIRKLNRPRREKIFMCVLMGLGLFASCAAIIRTLTLRSFYTSSDIFRNGVMTALWAIVEQWFTLIAATIPTLKAFLEKGLVKIGLFFYDEKTELQVRDRLVDFGFLGEDERLESGETTNREKKTSDLDSPSLRSEKKLRDEYYDSVLDTKNDKDLEEMLERSPV